MPSGSEYRADIGIALDGDADRALIADENGMLIDGDQVMAVIANQWRTSGQLKMNGVVATVMSNMGLERYLAGIGLTLERTKVGDRTLSSTCAATGSTLVANSPGTSSSAITPRQATD